jgi:hypothetical protein
MATKRKKSNSTKAITPRSLIAPSTKEQDPPIVVGGGGSVFVFIKDSATRVSPSPKPGYICYKLNVNIKKVHVYDGVTPGLTSRDVKDAAKHFTQFDD